MSRRDRFAIHCRSLRRTSQYAAIVIATVIVSIHAIDACELTEHTDSTLRQYAYAYQPPNLAERPLCFSTYPTCIAASHTCFSVHLNFPDGLQNTSLASTSRRTSPAKQPVSRNILFAQARHPNEKKARSTSKDSGETMPSDVPSHSNGKSRVTSRKDWRNASDRGGEDQTASREKASSGRKVRQK